MDDLLTKERSDKASTYRPKGETTEERNERKKALKEERKVRPNTKKPVFRVTRPYLNLLVKPRSFFRFSEKKKYNFIFILEKK